MTKLFAPGDTIVERGIFFGGVFFARPHRVISHDDEVLATFLPIGTRYFGAMFENRERVLDELREGVEWGLKAWHTHSMLTLVRPGDPYAIMGFWNEAADFVAWYVNLQDPLRWTDIGYDTRDHVLDLIVGEDLTSWMWKDEQELVGAVEMGLYTPEEAVQFRAAGESVVEMVEAGRAWWSEWRHFTPDPSWPLPEFPPGWDKV